MALHVLDRKHSWGDIAGGWGLLDALRACARNVTQDSPVSDCDSEALSLRKDYFTYVFKKAR